MRHRPHPARLAAVLILCLMLLSGFFALPATAQDDPTPEPTAAATGTLIISTFTCVRDDLDAGTISVTSPDSLAEFECAPGDAATITIDGAEPIDAADGDSVEIAAGVHTVTEVSQGASLELELPEGGEVAVAISTAIAPDDETPEDDATATEEGSEAAGLAQAAEGTLRVVTHLCRLGFDDAAALDALEWAQQVVACPVAVLPADYGDVTPDAVTANDSDNPLPYDLTITYEAAGSAAAVSIADASLATAALCESELGNLNGDADDDRCWDQSGYEVTDADEGAAEIAATDLPEGYSLALARGADGSDDGSAITSYDADSVSLDTAGNPEVIVHLFLLPEPLENTVTVIGHRCPEPITSRDAFTAIGDYWAQIAACPSFVLPGDSPAPDGVTAGELDATIAVRGADEVSQAMADVPFEQRLVCESDLPQDVDGDPNNDLCLDLSRYVFSGVTQGDPVTVDATEAAPGTKYVGLTFEPGSDDDATFKSAGASGTIKLNTTADGDVTVHVFYGPEPPPTATPTATRTPTQAPTPGGPTATRTPTQDEPTATSTPDPDGPTATPTGAGGGGTGSLQLYKRWCEGDDSLSRIVPLAPGADASRDDLGDATCANGDTEFILYNASGAELRTFEVPPVGVLRIDNLPESGGAGSYRVFDTRSSKSGSFEIAAGVTTKVISLQWMPVEEIDDPPPFPTIDPDNGAAPTEEGDCFDEGCEFVFDGPVAAPGGGDPFTVADDPEAEARVGEVDSFEDMPGVGVGRGEPRRSEYLPWMIVLALIGGVLAVIRIRR